MCTVSSPKPKPVRTPGGTNPHTYSVRHPSQSLWGAASSRAPPGTGQAGQEGSGVGGSTTHADHGGGGEMKKLRENWMRLWLHGCRPMWDEVDGVGWVGGGGHSEAGGGRPKCGGEWAATTVKGPPHQLAQPPVRQLLGSVDADTRHQQEHGPQRPSEHSHPQRREERVTVQGPVKKRQPDRMSHGGRGVGRRQWQWQRDARGLRAMGESHPTSVTPGCGRHEHKEGCATCSQGSCVTRLIARP